VDTISLFVFLKFWIQLMVLFAIQFRPLYIIYLLKDEFKKSVLAIGRPTTPLLN